MKRRIAILVRRLYYTKAALSQEQTYSKSHQREKRAAYQLSVYIRQKALARRLFFCPYTQVYIYIRYIQLYQYLLLYLQKVVFGRGKGVAARNRARATREPGPKVARTLSAPLRERSVSPCKHTYFISFVRSFLYLFVLSPLRVIFIFLTVSFSIVVKIYSYGELMVVQFYIYIYIYV